MRIRHNETASTLKPKYVLQVQSKFQLHLNHSLYFYKPAIAAKSEFYREVALINRSKYVQVKVHPA